MIKVFKKENTKVLATSGTLEGIKKLVKDYYMGSTMSYEEEPNGWLSISNKKGKIKDVFIKPKEKGKFKFIDINY
ncbi:hypothetical protein LCGC14_1844120 [marine sediment metagenome]|uniref:Uncharacterized protein n=1 Tax=marine sediment metagenome TaxID=412755 RepID=A0A0F9GCJ6_9ZZZZ